jgi:hypothetical protein
MISNERVPHPAGAALVSFQGLLSRRDAINAELEEEPSHRLREALWKIEDKLSDAAKGLGPEWSDAWHAQDRATWDQKWEQARKDNPVLDQMCLRAEAAEQERTTPVHFHYDGKRFVKGQAGGSFMFRICRLADVPR